MADPILLSGDTRVSNGHDVRMRFLRDNKGEVNIDRPLRENSFKIQFPETTSLPVPEETGTYELTGTVHKAMYGEHGEPDHLFLESDWEVNQIAETVERIDVSEPTSSDDPSPGDYTDTDVDFDVESLSSVEVTNHKGLSSSSFDV